MAWPFRVIQATVPLFKVFMSHVGSAAVGGDMCDGGCGGTEGKVRGHKGLGSHGGLSRIVVGLASPGGSGKRRKTLYRQGVKCISC